MTDKTILMFNESTVPNKLTVVSVSCRPIYCPALSDRHSV